MRGEPTGEPEQHALQHEDVPALPPSAAAAAGSLRQREQTRAYAPAAVQAEHHHKALRRFRKEEGRATKLLGAALLEQHEQRKGEDTGGGSGGGGDDDGGPRRGGGGGGGRGYFDGPSRRGRQFRQFGQTSSSSTSSSSSSSSSLFSSLPQRQLPPPLDAAQQWQKGLQQKGLLKGQRRRPEHDTVGVVSVVAITTLRHPWLARLHVAAPRQVRRRGRVDAACPPPVRGAAETETAAAAAVKVKAGLPPPRMRFLGPPLQWSPAPEK